MGRSGREAPADGRERRGPSLGQRPQEACRGPCGRQTPQSHSCPECAALLGGRGDPLRHSGCRHLLPASAFLTNFYPLQEQEAWQKLLGGLPAYFIELTERPWLAAYLGQRELGVNSRTDTRGSLETADHPGGPGRSSPQGPLPKPRVLVPPPTQGTRRQPAGHPVTQTWDEGGGCHPFLLSPRVKQLGLGDPGGGQ